MAKQLYLIKMGEIALKGQNRVHFEKKLKLNIKEKLRPYHSNVVRQKGRLFFYIDEECPRDLIHKALSTTFGITGFAEAVVCEKNIDVIREKAKKLLVNSPFTNKGTFRIETRRESKQYPLTSLEISIMLAEDVHELFPDLTVNLKHADYVLHAEIRSQAYLYTSTFPGLGGLPVATAGKGMLLLSGGIDSPVAAYMMAKRGLRQDCIYYHAYPYTSDESLEKVKTLARLIAPYLNGTRLIVVPFTEPQLHIRDKGYEEESTLMFRAAMMKTSNKIMQKMGGDCLVTGEALSQVASQTLKSLEFSNSMSDALVIRPLIGMDKSEIIEISQKIGTYETSILPYEDCCVIFSPKHPVTNPNVSLVTEHFNYLEMDDLIDEAVKNIEVFAYDAQGNLTFTGKEE